MAPAVLLGIQSRSAPASGANSSNELPHLPSHPMFPVNRAPGLPVSPPTTIPPAISADGPTVDETTVDEKVLSKHTLSERTVSERIVSERIVSNRTSNSHASNTASLTARTRIFPEAASPSARTGHTRQQPIDWRPIAPIDTLSAVEEEPAVEKEITPHPEKSALAAGPRQELSKLLKRFTAGDIDLPRSTAGVYADVAITEYKLRLYALVWAVEALLEPELSLFLILGPTQGSYLPMDTQLTVKENNLLLTEQTLRWTSTPTYLYTQVFGTWEEKFTVEIALPHARPLSLPPLRFALD